MDVVDLLKSESIIDTTTGCWLYQKTVETGYGRYGRITIEGKSIYVHRLSASIFLGLDLEDLEQLACHELICPNKNCWNPEHLYIGNNSSNACDKHQIHSHPNLTKTHCPKGHKYNEENTLKYNGKRHCRECSKLYMRNRRTRIRQKFGSLTHVVTCN